MTELRITLTIDTNSDDANLKILNDFDDLTFDQAFFIYEVRERLIKHLEVDLQAVSEMLKDLKGFMHAKGISETPQED